MANSISNPFYGVSVGSSVRDSDGSIAAPVLVEGLTIFASGVSGEIHMSGSSEYLYTDSMNQGSLGVSGSYGVSGVSKASAAVSAYVGKTEAFDGRTTSLSINLVTWAGIEYVNFNELGVSEFVEGMKSNTKARLTAALDAFNAMRKADDTERTSAIQTWLRACNAFFEADGNGVVVGVLWGAYGSVTMTFEIKSSEEKWTFGGEGDFSYAGTGASVAVSAAYGGSRSHIGQNATASVTASYNGEAVKSEITAWAKEFSTTAAGGLNALGKQKITRNAALTDMTQKPSIPDFIKPKASDKLTKKIGDIEDLEGLKTYAAAAAYDKYVANGGDQSLDDFLRNREESNDINGLAEGALGPNPENDPMIEQDDLILDEELENIANQQGVQATLLTRRQAAPMAKAMTPTGTDQSSKFEPMGLWITPWARLFPWLVSGHDNRVLEGADANEVIRLRSFLQDCRSLARIYGRVAHMGAEIPGVDFKALRDAMLGAAESASEMIGVTPPQEIATELGRILDRMNSGAQKALRVWGETPVLRTYELGGGLVTSLSENFKEQGTLEGLFETTSTPFKDSFQGRLLMKTSGFELKTNNTVAFSRFIKVAPVVLPDGNIVAYLTNTDRQTSGFLCAIRWPSKLPKNKNGDPIDFSDVLMRKTAKVESDGTAFGHPRAANESPVLFSVQDERLVAGGTTQTVEKRTDDIAYGTRCIYHLVPIPFTAAKGISDWMYGATTTGSGNLNLQLDNLRASLKDLPMWSLDSDMWDGTNWSEHIYSTRLIKPSYVGLTPEPQNIFG